MSLWRWVVDWFNTPDDPAPAPAVVVVSPPAVKPAARRGVYDVAQGYREHDLRMALDYVTTSLHDSAVASLCSVIFGGLWEAYEERPPADLIPHVIAIVATYAGDKNVIVPKVERLIRKVQAGGDPVEVLAAIITPEPGPGDDDTPELRRAFLDLARTRARHYLFVASPFVADATPAKKEN